MAKRVIVFSGNQPSSKVREFFKSTGAEALDMKTEIIDNQFYLTTLIDVDPRAFDSYPNKNTS